MKLSGYLRRMIWNDKVVARGAGIWRTVLCALFIALIALFFTSPVSVHSVHSIHSIHSVHDKPLPLPAKLGLK